LFPPKLKSILVTALLYDLMVIFIYNIF